MGDITDAILNGDLCEECGCGIGPGEGYPRKCSDCASQTNRHAKVHCPTCGKRVNPVGLTAHVRDVHGIGAAKAGEEAV